MKGIGELIEVGVLATVEVSPGIRRHRLRARGTYDGNTLIMFFRHREVIGEPQQLGLDLEEGRSKRGWAIVFYFHRGEWAEATMWDDYYIRDNGTGDPSFIQPSGPGL